MIKDGESTKQHSFSLYKQRNPEKRQVDPLKSGVVTYNLTHKIGRCGGDREGRELAVSVQEVTSAGKCVLAYMRVACLLKLKKKYFAEY